MPEEEKTTLEKPKLDGITVPLRQPITANGDEVSSLTFREPTAADIERVGNPVVLDPFTSEVPKISFDTRLMTQMMSVLATVPPSSIRQMHPKDWNNAAWMLLNFFTPDL